MTNLRQLPVAILAVTIFFARFQTGAVAEDTAFVYPRIQGHGKVVRLPDAAAQPRAGSKLCVDLTVGGQADAVNPGLKKVARFVNLYAGAGRQNASCQMTVILHGDATAVALSDAAYAQRLGPTGNPSLPLLRKLQKAGVEVLVCGQALAHKGYAAEDVAQEVTVAVSALTVNVNRQTAGAAYIPLH